MQQHVNKISLHMIFCSMQSCPIQSTCILIQGKFPFRGCTSRLYLAQHRPYIAHTQPKQSTLHCPTQHNIAHTPHMLNRVCGVCAMLLHGSTSPFPAIPLLTFTSAHHCNNFASIIFLWCSPSLARTQPIHSSNPPSLDITHSTCLSLLYFLIE